MTWWDRAACYGLHDLFYPDAGQDMTEAKKVCATCPVVDQCRRHWNRLPADQQRHGVWWGTTPRDRTVCVQCGAAGRVAGRARCRACVTAAERLSVQRRKAAS